MKNFAHRSVDSSQQLGELPPRIITPWRIKSHFRRQEQVPFGMDNSSNTTKARASMLGDFAGAVPIGLSEWRVFNQGGGAFQFQPPAAGR